MTMPRPWMLLALPLAIVAAVEPLAAQYRSVVPGWGNFSRMRQHYSTRATIRATQRMPSDRAGAPSPQRGPGLAAGTTFRPQAAQLAPRLIAAEARGSAADRAMMEKDYTEILGVYRGLLSKAGGAQHDVARSAAFLVSNSYQVYFDRPALSKAAFDAVRRQLAAAFASDPAFRRKTDRAKQIEFELYAILGTAVTLEDPTQKPRLKRLARENLVGLLGAEPERIAITDQGMTIGRARE